MRRFFVNFFFAPTACKEKVAKEFRQYDKLYAFGLQPEKPDPQDRASFATGVLRLQNISKKIVEKEKKVWYNNFDRLF